MSTSNLFSSLKIKTVAVYAAVGLLCAGIGVLSGIVPTRLHLSDAEMAIRECPNCGVVQDIKIAHLGDKPATVAGTRRGEAASGDEASLLKAARFVVTVRMMNGDLKYVSQELAPDFRSGEKVKIENDVLVAGYY